MRRFELLEPADSLDVAAGAVVEVDVTEEVEVVDVPDGSDGELALRFSLTPRPTPKAMASIISRPKAIAIRFHVTIFPDGPG